MFNPKTSTTPKFVAYYRVSTSRQGKSGLGSDAQRDCVRSYAAAGGEIVAEFTEIETGKRSDRPELAKALARTRRAGATLVVAKLDRMSREVHFLSGLIKGIGGDVSVAFCDLPQLPDGPIGRFMIHMLAAVAELEAGMISRRTTDALTAYKTGKRVSRRIRDRYPDGVPPEIEAAYAGKLGAHHPDCKSLSQEARAKGQDAAVKTMKKKARDEYAELEPLLLEWQAAGSSLRQIAGMLNGAGHQTAQGKPWSSVQVYRALKRILHGVAS
jgi:DNA invertase Pin-like site-specific DNA recombinase